MRLIPSRSALQSQRSHFYSRFFSTVVSLSLALKSSQSRNSTAQRRRHLSYTSPARASSTQPSSPTKQQHAVTGVLAGKTCLVTGSSRGIGLSIARRFAREGAACILSGRDTSRLDTALTALKGETGSSYHRGVEGDVGSEEFWAKFKGQKIDILVNAAGLTHYSPLFVTSTSLIEQVLRTNLNGTVLGCRSVGKSMLLSKNGGCIINVASLLGVKGGRGSVAYAASKAGIIGLTRSLAAEVGERGIRVNVIVPGYIETDMTDVMTQQARASALSTIPLKRFGTPDEVAEAAMFLATNQYANNCILNLDGGLSAV